MLGHNLDSLDFGRPSTRRTTQHDHMCVEEALNAEMSKSTVMCCDDVFIAATKKAGRKEVNPKQLSEVKWKELEEERKK